MTPYLGEFRRHLGLISGALDQVDDGELVAVAADGSSIAIIIQHLTGNLRSRFTDFLTSDGEKPWRDRDREFVARHQTRESLLRDFSEAFAILVAAIEPLGPDDRGRIVTIRGMDLSVDEALCRSLAHFAYHAGQIVIRAKERRGADWRSLSIAPGHSTTYNAKPDRSREVIRPT